jgi:2-oxoglutarate dehydrogenase E1 component
MHISKLLCLFAIFQSWDSYFRNNSYSAPPSLAPLQRNHVPASQYMGSSLPAVGGGAAGLGGRIDDKLIDDHLAVQAIIRSYQVNYNTFLQKVKF